MSRARNRFGSDIESFLCRIARVVADVQRLLGSGEVSQRDVDSCIVRVEYLIGNVERVGDVLQAHQCQSLVSGLRNLLLSIEACRIESPSPRQSLSIRRTSGSRGSPLFDIPQQQLQFLIHYGFTGTDISSLLGVSFRTLQRRLRDFGLSLRGQYSTLSDQELDASVARIGRDYPRAGGRTMNSLLESEGVRVQRSRVRASQLRVDPAGVALRWSDSTQRRVYRVHGPNSLWHIDGNHSLIRYKFCCPVCST